MTNKLQYELLKFGCDLDNDKILDITNKKINIIWNTDTW